MAIENQYYLNSFQRRDTNPQNQISSLNINLKGDLFSACALNGLIATWDISNLYNPRYIDQQLISDQGICRQVEFLSENRLVVIFDESIVFLDALHSQILNQIVFENNQSKQQKKFCLQQNDFILVLYDSCLAVLNNQFNQIIKDCSENFNDNIIRVFFDISNLIVIQKIYNIDVLYFDPDMMKLNYVSSYQSLYGIQQLQIRNFPQSYQIQNQITFEIIIFNNNSQFIIFDQNLKIIYQKDNIPLSEAINILFVQSDPNDIYYFISGNNPYATFKFQNYIIPKFQNIYYLAGFSFSGDMLINPQKSFNQMAEIDQYTFQNFILLSYCSVFNFYTWNLEKSDSVNSNLEFYFGVFFSQLISKNQLLFFGDFSGISGFNTIQNEEYILVYKMPSEEVNNGDEIQSVKQNMKMGKYFVIKSNILVFSLYTNQLIERIDLSQPFQKVQQFEILEAFNSILILKDNTILLRDYTKNCNIQSSSLGTIQNFILNEDKIYTYGDKLTILDLNLKILKQTDYIVNGDLDCILSSNKIFCKTKQIELLIIDNISLNLNHTIQSGETNFQIAIDDQYQNIFLYNNLIQIYSFEGQFLKTINLQQDSVNELQFYQENIACRTGYYITILDRSSFVIKNSFQALGQGFILGMYFLSSFNHLAIYTDNVQYGQILFYDLNSFDFYGKYSNSYSLNSKSQVSQVSYDNEQYYFSYLDSIGNFQTFSYVGQINLQDLIKFIDISAQSKAKAKGFSLDFKNNNLYIYTQLSVYQVSYGDLGNRVQFFKTQNSNIFCSLEQQDLFFNNLLIIAGEEGVLYKYTNNQLKYFYNFQEDITQIFYSAEQDYMIVALSKSIACFKQISNQIFLNKSGWQLDHTLSLLNDKKFVKFFTYNIFLTVDNSIWHYDFLKQQILFQFKLNDRITSDLYSQENNILYLGLSTGEFIIYDITQNNFQTINIQQQLNQTNTVISPIIYIIETYSFVWICYLSQYGIYTYSKSSMQFEMILDFSQIQTYQYQKEKNVDMFGVDEVYERFFLNFATEQIVRVYSYQKQELMMNYLMLTKKQTSKLQITQNLVVLQSSAFIMIRDRKTLEHKQTIRKENIYDFIKQLIIIEDTYFLIAFEAKYELISIHADNSIQYMDQQRLSYPIFMKYQIIQDAGQYSNGNKMLQVILLSMDSVIEFQYNLNYEEMQDNNKQCGVNICAASYLDMLQKLQNVKPISSITPYLLESQKISKQNSQYMLTLQSQSLSIVSYKGTQDSSLVISSNQITEYGNKDLQTLIIEEKSFQEYQKQEINLKDFQIQFNQPNLNITFGNSTKIINFQNINISNQNIGQIQFQFVNQQMVIIDHLSFSQNERASNNNQQFTPFLLFRNCSQVFIYNLLISNNGQPKHFYNLLQIENVSLLKIQGLKVFNTILQQLIQVILAKEAFISDVDISNCSFNSNNLNQSSSQSYVFNLISLQNTNITNIQFKNNSNLQLLQTVKQYDNSLAFYILQSDSIHLYGLQLIGNNQTQDLYIPLIKLQNTFIIFNQLNYQNNVGNFQVLFSTQINISSSIFINNISEDGGSLNLNQCVELIDIQNTSFINNQALASGGALYIEDFYGKINFGDDVIFKENKALIGGGIRIVNKNYVNEDQIWYKHKSLFSQNTASLFGNNFATYLSAIKIENNFQKSQFDTDINYEPPDFLFIDQNQMGQSQKNQWLSIVQYSNFKSGSYLMMNIQIFDIEGNIFKFQVSDIKNNIYPPQIVEEIKGIYFKIETNEQSNISINGQNIVTYEQFMEEQSLFSFSQVTISSIPTHQKDIQISYSISSQNNQNLKPIKLTIHFRTCKVGEILKQADQGSYNCEQCKFGYYSLEDPTKDTLWNKIVLQETNQTSQVQLQCNECPDSALNCQSNLIQIKDGYWRANNQTSEIVKCNQNVNSCQPNNPENINGCNEGYIGPICSVCDVVGQIWRENRFTHSFVDSTQCEKCSPQKDQIIFITFTFIFLCLYFLISVIMFTNNFTHYQTCQYLRLMQVIPIYKHQIKDQSIFYLKIFINFIQINSLVIPQPFSLLTRFISYFPSFVNSPSNKIVISLSCILDKDLIEQYGYSHVMQVLYAILPLFFVAVMTLLIKIFEKLKLFGIKNFHLFTLINFMYIYFQPNQINFYSKQLSCTQIGSNEYVASDLLIDCDDASYRQIAFAISIPCLIFWSLIPIIVYFGLKKNSKKLNYCLTRYCYGYYYTEYKQKFYYWEFIRIYIRILIVLINSLLKNSYSFVNYQIIILILYLYTKASFAITPFKNRNHQRCDTSCYQVIVLNCILSAINISLNEQFILGIIYFLSYSYIVVIFLHIIFFKISNPSTYIGKIFKYVFRHLLPNKIFSLYLNYYSVNLRVFLRWKKIQKNLKILISHKAINKINHIDKKKKTLLTTAMNLVSFINERGENQTNEFSVNFLQNSKNSHKKSPALHKKVKSIKSTILLDSSNVDNYQQAKSYLKNQKDSLYKQENVSNQLERKFSLFYIKEAVKNQQQNCKNSQEEEEINDIFDEQHQIEQTFQMQFRQKQKLDTKQNKQ